MPAGGDQRRSGRSASARIASSSQSSLRLVRSRQRSARRAATSRGAKSTGRSPKDKHIVKTDSVADNIWWENNRAMTPEGFDALHADMLEHMKGKDYFVQDLTGGADPRREGVVLGD